MDELLTDLATQGWLMNNCYQTDARLWRVSLRRPTPDGDWFSDWAEGDTLEDALCECMSKLQDATFAESTPISAFIEAPINLLQAIGFAKPAAPIKRRF